MPREAWKGSTRRATLPKDWEAIRRGVLRDAGYRCVEMTTQGRCTNVANQCDHIGDRDDHSRENLQALCEDHHNAKSARQGVEARRARRAAEKRPGETPPSALR